MKERYYAGDGKTYAIREGGLDDGRTVWSVYYDGWYAKCEVHEVKLYDWSKRLHGNAPSGTPYGFFRASRTGQRIIITV